MRRDSTVCDVATGTSAFIDDDRIADRHGLADPEERAGHVRSIVDGYGVAAADRHRLVELMIDVAVTDAADQARDVTPDSRDSEVLWRSPGGRGQRPG